MGTNVYFFLPIVLFIFLLTWFLLKRFARKWIERPPTFFESILNGVIAWIFVASLVFWFAGIIYILIGFLTTHEIKDIWALIFSVLLSGYGIDFYYRSKSGMSIDDTTDFIKEELQFRRSSQRRMSVLDLIELRRKKREQATVNVDPEALQRLRLRADLNKGKELDIQLELLREGKIIDITEVWRIKAKSRGVPSLYEKVDEARVDPNRKRLVLYILFPDLDEKQLLDDTTMIRFNRNVYDFLQSLNTEPWLKPYKSFIDSYFLLCRTNRVAENNEQVLYPFMKLGILISKLRKLEGSYFNPRKLNEIATLAFNNGAPV